MLLEAIITKADLDRVVGQFLPTDIAMEDGAKLSLHAPFDIALVADRGIRVACNAKVRWPVAGLHIPIDVHSLVVLVELSVGQGADGATLDLRLNVEKVDFAVLPRAIDDRIRARINEVLVARHIGFSWNFQDTLSRVIALPATIESSGAFALEVQSGVVRITADALAFAVSYATGVRARTGVRAPGPSSSQRDQKNGAHNGIAQTPGGPGRGSNGAGDGIPLQGLLAASGAAATFALAAAFGLGRMSKR